MNEGSHDDVKVKQAALCVADASILIDSFALMLFPFWKLRYHVSFLSLDPAKGAGPGGKQYFVSGAIFRGIFDHARVSPYLPATI